MKTLDKILAEYPPHLRGVVKSIFRFNSRGAGKDEHAWKIAGYQTVYDAAVAVYKEQRQRIDLQTTVRVRLTDYGLRHLLAHYPDEATKVSKVRRVYKTSMWELMAMFGEWIYTGKEQFFVDDIIEILE